MTRKMLSLLCRINEQKAAVTESKESLIEKQRLEVCAHIARLSRTLEDMVTSKYLPHCFDNEE